MIQIMTGKRKVSNNSCSLSVFRKYRNRLPFKNILKVFSIGFLIWIYFWLIKIPNDRKLKTEEVQIRISSVLGTRLTAVRLLPYKNTTRAQPKINCEEDNYGVILIKSIPENHERRRILRKTWFKFLPDLSFKMTVLFFVGVPSEVGNITQELQKEFLQHNDIIIDDLQEDYYLLGLKSLRMLKWFNSTKNCLKSRYLIKTDDDVYLMLPNLVEYMTSLPQQFGNYIGGQLHMSDPVTTDPYSKWFSPKEWNGGQKTYPPFVSGALTIMSSEVVGPLLKESLNVPLFHLEDVFLIGMVAYKKLKIMPQDIPKIESQLPMWSVKLQLRFLSWFNDIANANLAFHCAEDINLMEDLYNRNTRN